MQPLEDFLTSDLFYKLDKIWLSVQCQKEALTLAAADKQFLDSPWTNRTSD